MVIEKPGTKVMYVPCYLCFYEQSQETTFLKSAFTLSLQCTFSTAGSSPFLSPAPSTVRTLLPNTSVTHCPSSNTHTIENSSRINTNDITDHKTKSASSRVPFVLKNTCY
jgi:hypothetical protein